MYLEQKTGATVLAPLSETPLIDLKRIALRHRCP